MSIIRDANPIPLTMLSISFLNGKNGAGMDFKGSHEGVRYLFRRLLKEESKDKKLKECKQEDFYLRVYVYKDLLNFEKTNDKDKIYKDFEFSKDGIEEGLIFIENNLNKFT